MRGKMSTTHQSICKNPCWHLGGETKSPCLCGHVARDRAPLPPDHEVQLIIHPHYTLLSQALFYAFGYILIKRLAKAEEVESCQGKKPSTSAPSPR